MSIWVALFLFGILCAIGSQSSSIIVCAKPEEPEEEPEPTYYEKYAEVMNPIRETIKKRNTKWNKIHKQDNNWSPSVTTNPIIRITNDGKVTVNLPDDLTIEQLTDALTGNNKT